jgi:SAM-dependent methyltransferase
MDAHKLEFPDQQFDFVYGVAILHHLDLARSIQEIARVTKPGGRILFVEPLRLNPIAQLIRFVTPNARTPDERPLGREELRIIDGYFKSDHLFTELFHAPAAILSRFIFRNPVNPLTRSFDALDRTLLAAFPGLGVFYRTVTVYGRIRSDAMGASALGSVSPLPTKKGHAGGLQRTSATSAPVS